MAQRDTVMKHLVVDAIERAQVAHPGAEVMLTGHSQGGIVAATVASDNPDAANWTTVRRDLADPEGTNPEHTTGLPEVGRAHSTDNYVRTGRLIDRSTDPTVVAWREQNAQFFSADHASSTIYVIEPTSP